MEVIQKCLRSRAVLVLKNKKIPSEISSNPDRNRSVYLAVLSSLDGKMMSQEEYRLSVKLEADLVMQVFVVVVVEDTGVFRVLLEPL